MYTHPVRVVTALGMGWIALLAAAQGCGGSSTQPVCPMGAVPFSPAAITVDPNKQMAALTTDERASVCAEFSRALTDSVGSVAVQCQITSHGGTQQDQATCRAAYDQCLQTSAPTPIMYCTDKMSGMWSCPITIGQYQACFNEAESFLLSVYQLAPVCQDTVPQCTAPATRSCAGASGRCDYTWFD
jgi:hypothetical protein